MGCSGGKLTRKQRGMWPLGGGSVEEDKGRGALWVAVRTIMLIRGKEAFRGEGGGWVYSSHGTEKLLDVGENRVRASWNGKVGRRRTAGREGKVKSTLP